ncbi:DUF2806 domain-containing protein [Rhodopirellula europaea]|uniref:DUF2806 domain-containing protein n=1 Tax=Rhodopirellula europaea SH398 TaxID=1263868 RepID=M5S6L8_9BACT|nr:DUF2806 domain-containing protein [Rhodopirellula europaea]EMI23287.1 hypothetical protein RESH_06189 [Rhodopirellula europaea SH398]
MEIKDLAGLSEPLTRLIEVISKGVGAVTQPYLIRKVADARAHEIRTIAEALGDVSQEQNLPVVYKDGAIEVWQKPDDQTLILESRTRDERSDLRIEYQERKRQSNVEHITSVAAAELCQEETVPDEKPDDDWVTRFFSNAEDVSSAEMQDLWGRILAGEITRPGSYSLRTLDFVRNLSKSDAELLENLGRFAFSYHGFSFVDIHDKKWLQDNRNIYPVHQFSLSELGVVYPADLQLRTFGDAQVSEVGFEIGDHLLLVKRGEITSEVKTSIWKFTSIGKELLHLVPKPLDDGYLDQFAKAFLQKKGEAYVATITERHSDGRLTYETLRQLDTA